MADMKLQRPQSIQGGKMIGREKKGKSIKRSVDNVYGCLHKKDNPVLTVAQMNDAVKKRFSFALFL